MQCMIVSMTLSDLMGRQMGIQNFAAEDQTKALSKEREKWKKANLKNETVDLTSGLEELKMGVEVLCRTSPLNERKSRLDSLEKVVKDIKTNQEKEIKELIESQAKNKMNQDREMKEFNESHAKNIEKLKGEFEQQIQEADHYLKKKFTEIKEEKKKLNQDITTPKEENVVMKNELKECEDKNYCQSYILQVCFNLLANMFHFVLPDHFAEDWLYKVKDIKEAINDEDLFKDAERQEALKRWEGLKEKLGWEPSIERTLKMLQREGNPMECAGDLTVKEAERVAKELNKQGRLRGRTSYENVKKIIEMWEISTNLVQSLP